REFYSRFYIRWHRSRKQKFDVRLTAVCVVESPLYPAGQTQQLPVARITHIRSPGLNQPAADIRTRARPVQSPRRSRNANSIVTDGIVTAVPFSRPVWAALVIRGVVSLEFLKTMDASRLDGIPL